jgi:hypothetical protein
MKDRMRRSNSLITQAKVSVKKRQRLSRKKGTLSGVTDPPADALQCAKTMVREVLDGGAACIKSHGKDETRGKREEKYFIHLEPDDLLGMLQGFHVSDDGEQYYNEAETDDQAERRLSFKRAATLAVAKQKKTDNAAPLPVAAAQLSPLSQEKFVREKAVRMNQNLSLEQMMLDTPWCGSFLASEAWCELSAAGFPKKQLQFASPSKMLHTPPAPKKATPLSDVAPSTVQVHDMNVYDDTVPGLRMDMEPMQEATPTTSTSSHILNGSRRAIKPYVHVGDRK